MATNPFNVQSFIQPLAQANTPFLANNGNPGTVYNIPATGGYVPPQSDANNNWAVNPFSNFAMPAPTSAYANHRFWENLGTGGSVGTGGPRFVIPPNGGGGTTPPTPWPPGTQPPTTTPPTTPPGGSTTTPPTTGGGNPDYPLHNGPGGTWSPPGGTPTTHINPPTGGGKSPGYGSFSGSVGEWLTTGAGGRALGTNADGSMNWQQIIDIVSEPWLQGNMYMSQTGKWNPQNIMTALLNTVIPGSGSLMNWLADKGLLGQKAQEWVRSGQYAQLGNEVLNHLKAEQNRLSDEENPVPSYVGNQNGLFPDTPFGNFNPGYVFGSGSMGYTPRTPTVSVGTPTTVTGPTNIEGPSNNPSRPNNSGGNNTSGSSSGSGGTSGGTSGGGIESDAGWQNLQNALNSASIYWWLDGTSRQAQDAMRRMFENQRQ